MSIKKQFLQLENVYLIWELLSEQDIIKNQNSTTKEEISNYVVNEIHKFYNIIVKNNNNISLINLNKEYIKYIILHVKSVYPVEMQKITIHNEESVPITYKEIQEQRELEFNTRFNELQKDFVNMTSITKPETPQFEDKMNDTPISITNMEEQIKEITKKRNYDLQSIENINDTINTKKSVSFEEKNEDEMQLDDKDTKYDIYNFFNNLDTYEETNIDEINTNVSNTNDDVNIIKTNTTIKNDDIQTQINQIKNQMNSLENKLDLILQKL